MSHEPISMRPAGMPIMNNLASVASMQCNENEVIWKSHSLIPLRYIKATKTTLHQGYKNQINVALWFARYAMRWRPARQPHQAVLARTNRPYFWRRPPHTNSLGFCAQGWAAAKLVSALYLAPHCCPHYSVSYKWRHLANINPCYATLLHQVLHYLICRATTRGGFCRRSLWRDNLVACEYAHYQTPRGYWLAAHIKCAH